MKSKKLTNKQQDILRDRRDFLELKAMTGMMSKEDIAEAMQIKRKLYFPNR